MATQLTRSLTTILLATGMLLTVNAHADQDTQLLSNGYYLGQGSPGRSAYLEVPYDISRITTGNTVLSQLLTTPYTAAAPYTLQSIVGTLTAVDSEKTVKNAVRSISAPLTAPSDGPVNPLLPPTSSSPSEAAANKALSFDLNSLLAPTGYQNQNDVDQQQNAQNFISLVSGLGNPLPVLNFTGLKNSDGDNLSNNDIKNLVTRPDVAAYLIALRTYAAQLATGLGPLYRLYAERIPVSNLAEEAGIPSNSPVIANNSSSTSASPLQVREYLATRRITDSEWYNEIQTASPAQVQRQALILLAEQRAESFYVEQQLEHLTALLSVLVMQNAQSQRIMMVNQASSIQKTAPFTQQS